MFEQELASNLVTNPSVVQFENYGKFANDLASKCLNQCAKRYYDGVVKIKDSQASTVAQCTVVWAMLASD